MHVPAKEKLASTSRVVSLRACVTFQSLSRPSDRTRSRSAVKRRLRTTRGITGSIDRHAAATPPTDDANHVAGESRDGEAGAPLTRARPGLRRPCARRSRLAPQGSDAWNFLAAFSIWVIATVRTIPVRLRCPTRSRPSASREAATRAPARVRQGGIVPEGRPRAEDGSRGGDGPRRRGVPLPLSARVATLEARLASEDQPVDERRGSSRRGSSTRGWALWPHTCSPARPEATSCTPTVGGRPPRCARGTGTAAHGVEPRGAVALRALEGGCSVTIGEAFESGGSAGSLGGIVLNGMVDRLPLHTLLPLLAQCRRTLAYGAPLVIVSELVGAGESREPPAADLVDGRPLRPAATWELLLERSGFVEVAPLDGAAVQDHRLALTSVPPRRAGFTTSSLSCTAAMRWSRPSPAPTRAEPVVSNPRSTSTRSTRRRGRDGARALLCPGRGEGRCRRLSIRDGIGDGAVAGRRENLVVNYHNITPPELMAPWDNHLALGQLRAQGDLRLLAPRTALAVADSAYNQAHLAQAGFATTAVIPPSAGLDPTVTTATAQAEPPGGARRGGGRRPGVAQQGDREHHRRAGRRPGPRRPRGDAAGHRQARHGLLRRRPAPLRRRDGTGRCRHLRRARERRHRGVGLCRHRCARRDLGARGILRPRGGGDGRRAPRRRVRPGGGA